MRWWPNLIMTVRFYQTTGWATGAHLSKQKEQMVSIWLIHWEHPFLENVSMPRHSNAIEFDKNTNENDTNDRKSQNAPDVDLKKNPEWLQTNEEKSQILYSEIMKFSEDTEGPETIGLWPFFIEEKKVGVWITFRSTWHWEYCSIHYWRHQGDPI